MSKSYTVGYMPKPSYSGTKYEELKDVLKESGIISENTPDNAIPTVVEESLVDLKPENVRGNVKIGSVNGTLVVTIDDFNIDSVDLVDIPPYTVSDVNSIYSFSSYYKHGNYVYGSYDTSAKKGLYRINLYTLEEDVAVSSSYNFTGYTTDGSGLILVTTGSYCYAIDTTVENFTVNYMYSKPMLSQKTHNGNSYLLIGHAGSTNNVYKKIDGVYTHIGDVQYVNKFYVDNKNNLYIGYSSSNMEYKNYSVYCIANDQIVKITPNYGQWIWDDSYCYNESDGSMYLGSECINSSSSSNRYECGIMYLDGIDSKLIFSDINASYLDKFKKTVDGDLYCYSSAFATSIVYLKGDQASPVIINGEGLLYASSSPNFYTIRDKNYILNHRYGGYLARIEKEKLTIIANQDTALGLNPFSSYMYNTLSTVYLWRYSSVSSEVPVLYSLINDVLTPLYVSSSSISKTVHTTDHAHCALISGAKKVLYCVEDTCKVYDVPTASSVGFINDNIGNIYMYSRSTANTWGVYKINDEGITLIYDKSFSCTSAYVSDTNELYFVSSTALVHIQNDTYTKYPQLKGYTSVYLHTTGAYISGTSTSYKGLFNLQNNVLTQIQTAGCCYNYFVDIKNNLYYYDAGTSTSTSYQEVGLYYISENLESFNISPRGRYTFVSVHGVDIAYSSNTGVGAYKLDATNTQTIVSKGSNFIYVDINTNCTLFGTSTNVAFIVSDTSINVLGGVFSSFASKAEHVHIHNNIVYYNTTNILYAIKDYTVYKLCTFTAPNSNFTLYVYPYGDGMIWLFNSSGYIANTNAPIIYTKELKAYVITL